MKLPKFLAATTAAAALGTAAVPAEAQVITFDELGNPTAQTVFNSISSQGFNLTCASGFSQCLFMQAGNDPIFNNQYSPTTNYGFDTINFSKADGSEFLLDSFKASIFAVKGSAATDTLGVTYNFLDGSALYRTYNLTSDFTVISLGQKIVSLHARSLSSLSTEVDDFVIGQENAVPEPASWAMMVAGFGMLGAAMRRRQPAPSLS